MVKIIWWPLISHTVSKQKGIQKLTLMKTHGTWISTKRKTTYVFDISAFEKELALNLVDTYSNTT